MLNFPFSDLTDDELSKLVKVNSCHQQLHIMKQRQVNEINTIHDKCEVLKIDKEKMLTEVRCLETKCERNETQIERVDNILKENETLRKTNKELHQTISKHLKRERDEGLTMHNHRRNSLLIQILT